MDFRQQTINKFIHDAVKAELLLLYSLGKKQEEVI